jgi:hypothetical protein
MPDYEGPLKTAPIVIFTSVDGMFFLIMRGMCAQVSYEDLVTLHQLLLWIDARYDNQREGISYDSGKWSAQIVDDGSGGSASTLERTVWLRGTQPDDQRWVMTSRWTPLDTAVFHSGVKAMIKQHPFPYVIRSVVGNV